MLKLPQSLHNLHVRAHPPAPSSPAPGKLQAQDFCFSTCCCFLRRFLARRGWRRSWRRGNWRSTGEQPPRANPMWPTLSPCQRSLTSWRRVARFDWCSLLILNYLHGHLIRAWVVYNYWCFCSVGDHPLCRSPCLSGQHEGSLGAAGAQGAVLWADH